MRGEVEPACSTVGSTKKLSGTTGKMSFTYIELANPKSREGRLRRDGVVGVSGNKETAEHDRSEPACGVTLPTDDASPSLTCGVEETAADAGGDAAAGGVAAAAADAGGKAAGGVILPAADAGEVKACNVMEPAG